MLKPIFQRSFEKDIAKAKKRGKDLKKLENIIKSLLEEKLLPEKHRNHKLVGNYNGFWECHIEPDWLLIYKKTKTHIIFDRTGTHSDLF